MKRSPRCQETTLSHSVQKLLNSYALAASAAWVGALALVQPAEAKIIYTAAHKTLHNGEFDLDLNHDGKNDFHFYLQRFASRKNLAVTGALGNETWYFQGRIYDNCVYPAPRGALIGPKANFGPGRHWIFVYASGLNYCSWNRRAYVGLKFLIRGKVHFGWARFVTNDSVGSAKLTGYAYETIPNKAIIAGKTKGPDVTTVAPVSLGHLAAGASAIPFWRSGR